MLESMDIISNYMIISLFNCLLKDETSLRVISGRQQQTAENLASPLRQLTDHKIKQLFLIVYISCYS